ncbi:unnamed protein product, partial [Nesidiocoris tenuis]
MFSFGLEGMFNTGTYRAACASKGCLDGVRDHISNKKECSRVDVRQVTGQAQVRRPMMSLIGDFKNLAMNVIEQKFIST